MPTAGGAAELITALVNTRAILADNPYAREDLDSPFSLDRWWNRHAGASWPVPAGASDLDAALAVREGLRALLARNNDAETPGDVEAIARLDAVAADLPLRVSALGAPRPRLVPVTAGSPAEALADLLGRVAALGHDTGEWARLKVCRDPQCREAFVDTTRSRTRTWCSMELCGTRAKQRAFAERRHLGHRVTVRDVV